MKKGMKVSDLLYDIIGAEVEVDCPASCLHGWKGKVVEFYGSDGSRTRSESEEAGVNVLCDMMNTEKQIIETLSFAPEALKFL